MRKRSLLCVLGLALVAGCLQGCAITHDGTGKYVAKVEFGYEVDEHKNAAHAVSSYDTMLLSKALRYLFTGQADANPSTATP